MTTGKVCGCWVCCEPCVTSVWVSPELNAVLGLLTRGPGLGPAEELSAAWLPVQCSGFWAPWHAGSWLGTYVLSWSVTATIHLNSRIEKIAELKIRC